MDKIKMKETILSLTLEIIYLLTGEDYTVVKKTSENDVTPGTSGGGRRNREPTPQSYERNKVQKLLDLTCKMVKLLTAEVPIRCQDVAVYFSMEEWEYVEGHKDLYPDIMEDPRPLTPSVGFGNGKQNEEQNTSEPSTNSRKHKDGDNNGLPVDHTMCGSSHFLEESGNEGNFTNPKDQVQQYPFTYIKEEPVSNDGETITEPNVYPPTDHPQHDTTTIIKEEPASNDGETITEPNVYPPTDHPQQDTTTSIKEELASSDGGNLTDLTRYRIPPIKKEPDPSDGGTAMDTPTDYTQYPTIKKESLSCDEGITNTCISLDHIQHPSPYIKEEPLTCDKDLTESNCYRPSDHTQHQNTCIQEEPIPYDGGNLTDSYVYTPTDHTEYIPLPINKEPGNGGALIDLNYYTPREYTQHPTSLIKKKMVSGHRENPIDNDGHTPTDHRQPHPTTHIKEKYGDDVTDTNSGPYIDLTQHLIPRVEKDSASCNVENLVEMDIHAVVDGTRRYGSSRIRNNPIPIDHVHYSSTEEPVLGKEPTLQKPKCSSPEEPEAKDVGKKRKIEVEQNYMDLTLRSEKFICTIQQSTNSFEILYNCPECPACFTSNVELAKHQLNHTRRLPFICSLCGRCFGRKSDLVVHQVFHGNDTNASTHHTQVDTHGTVDGTEQPRPPHVNHKPDSYDGRFTTPDCTVPSDHTQPNPSTKESALEETSSLHKPETSSLENKHVGKKRKKQPEKNYNEITLSSQKYFCTIQQTTDSFQILYNCPECPEFFTSNIDLAKHQIIHAGGLSIICAVCGMSFGRKSDLLIHQITHGGSNDLPRKNSQKTTALPGMW